jgi:hypothetical protein
MVVSSLLVAWSSVRVGAAADLCGCTPSRSRLGVGAKPRAAIHGIAFALQGLVALLLLDLTFPAAIATVLIFVALGAATAYFRARRAEISHSLDMTVGMLTLGNLGMLLGWGADNGFARLHDGGCRCCIEAMRDGLLRPWMWVGMLAFANATMLFLARRGSERPYCRFAMFTGGNFGMVAGMACGAWLAGLFEVKAVVLGALVSYLGMTAGMVGGMLFGAELTRRSIGPLLRLRRLPKWFARRAVVEDAA